MRTIIMIFFVSILGLSGCASTHNTLPSDFVFHYEWDTGSLPPQYHYRIVIDVQADGQSTFQYQPGYSDEADAQAWQKEFALSQAQMDELFQAILEYDLLRNNWQKGELLIGGSSIVMCIQAENKEYRILSTAQMKTADRQSAESFSAFVYSLVPAEIWQEVETCRAAREN